MNNISIFEQEAIINLGNISSPAEVLFEISKTVESCPLSGKRIKLILGDVSLTNAHMFSIKSLIESSGAVIEQLISPSSKTQLAGLGAGLAVSDRFSPYDESDEEDDEEDVFDTLTEEMSHQQESSAESSSNEAGVQDEIAQTEENASEEIQETFCIEEDTNISTEKETVTDTAKPVEAEKLDTLYIKQTIRSGRTIKHEGNVLIIGDCHPGSEIVATGDITVWGTLSGIAHAGSKGNTNSRIRALKLNAIQLRIGNVYSRKPDKLLVEKHEKPTSFTPEEARVSAGEIVVKTLYQ